MICLESNTSRSPNRVISITSYFIEILQNPDLAKKIGTKLDDFTILDAANMEATIQDAGVKVAMVTTPAAYAQEVVDKLVDSGVQAILNYAPIQINTPPNIRVQYIDPATHLQRMSYYLD